MTQPEKIERIISKGCEYFGVAKAELYLKPGTRSSIWDKKRYMVLILNRYTACDYHDIAKHMGYASQHNVRYHIKAMESLISDDIYGSDKEKRVYKELLEYLDL